MKRERVNNTKTVKLKKDFHDHPTPKARIIMRKQVETTATKIGGIWISLCRSDCLRVAAGLSSVFFSVKISSLNKIFRKFSLKKDSKNGVIKSLFFLQQLHRLARFCEPTDAGQHPLL